MNTEICLLDYVEYLRKKKEYASSETSSLRDFPVCQTEGNQGTAFYTRGDIRWPNWFRLKILNARERNIHFRQIRSSHRVRQMARFKRRIHCFWIPRLFVGEAARRPTEICKTGIPSLESEDPVIAADTASCQDHNRDHRRGHCPG